MSVSVVQLVEAVYSTDLRLSDLLDGGQLLESDRRVAAHDLYIRVCI